MVTPVSWPSGGLNAGTPPAVFRRYIERNSERGLEEIISGEVTATPLYIVCSGPSLRETWHELIAADGCIWALNGAFDWLKDRYIVPDYGVCLAPENEILNYFRNIRRGNRFLFAMQTNPKLVDRALKCGGQVMFFHCAHPEEWKLPGKEPRVFGGGTVGSRAIDLAYVMGYRNIHILGNDACLSDDGLISVDRPMPDDRRNDLRTFFVNGRAFVALPSHARQVEDFASVLRHLNGVNITLYGDGMLQWSQVQEGNENGN